MHHAIPCGNAHKNTGDRSPVRTYPHILYNRPCQRIMACPAGRRSEHRAWGKLHQLEDPWGAGRWAGSSSDRLPLGRCLSGGPVEVVKHPVHNHPGHRHVEPKRERPASNSHVLLKLFGPGTVDRHQRQWNDTRGQDNVGDQQGEVHRSNPARPPKWRGADVVVVD